MTRRNDVRQPAPHVRSARRATPSTQPTRVNNVAVVEQDQPRFAQPEVTGAPPQYEVKHASDAAAYKILDEQGRAHELQPIPFPVARGGDEPVLTLAQILGSHGPDAERQVTAAGRLVFQAVGDTGNTGMGRHCKKKSLTRCCMTSQTWRKISPRFFFHLGDVIYSFGEERYYYDQFYDAYRNYPAPILALAGNHDGMVAPNTDGKSLDAFLRNFCAARFEITPEAGVDLIALLRSSPACTSPSRRRWCAF